MFITLVALYWPFIKNNCGDINFLIDLADLSKTCFEIGLSF